MWEIQRKKKTITLKDYMWPPLPPGLGGRKKTEASASKAWTNSWEKLIGSVDGCNEEGEVNSIDGNHEKITVTADSGAVDTVGPKHIAQGIPIKPTKASKEGRHYRAANGTQIKNYGQKRLEGVDKKGTSTGITIQVADVHKTLASVGRMTDADNTIIFSKGRSIITSDPDGEVAGAAFRACKPMKTTELEKKNGVYTFDMWIERQADNYQSPGQTFERGQTNTYHNIGAITGDFAWLEDEVM